MAWLLPSCSEAGEAAGPAKANLREPGGGGLCKSCGAVLCANPKANGKMPFTRFVEIGRVAMVSYGPEHGKLVVISDVVDQNRAVVDRPDETRRVMNFKRLLLTDFKCDLTRLAKKKELQQALDESGAFEKFAKSAWGQKLAKRKAKAALNDFERYQAMKKRQARNKEVAKVAESMQS